MRFPIVVVLLSVACSTNGHCDGYVAPWFAELGGHRFKVELADDPEEQQRGLMDRTELAADRGMVFRWGDVAERSFYMKDTLIPLDLIAVANGKVVSVASMVPCEQTPCITTKTAPANEVVEINGGLAEELGIEVGDPATFTSLGCA